MRTNMKTIQLLTAMTVATLTLAACSEEEKLPSDNWDGRIHISSNVATLTRATHDLDTKIGENVKVWLYIDKGSTGNDQVCYQELTSDGNNGFSGDDNLYFPAEESSINLYALHMNNSLVTNIPQSFPTTSQTHYVENDQKKPTSSGSSDPSNYAKSDLIYAKVTGKTKQKVKEDDGTIELEFTHLLSKIEVVLKKDASLGEITIDKVEILNTILSGTFTPDKSNDFSVTVASGAGVSAAAIEIDKDVTTDDSSPVLNEAIIIPQTLNENDAFIQLTLSTGGVLTYKLGSSDNKAFAAKTRYRYTITAKLTGLEVTSKIAAWTYDSSNDVTGEAGM